MSENEQVIQRLLEAEPLRAPVLREVVQAIAMPAGSRGLDIGCGIGLQCQLLAEAVGAGGQVSGVDVAPELLAYGQKMLDQASLASRVSLRQGDAGCLPFEDHSFDWAWSADCLGYPWGDLRPTLKEILRVVKPGGGIYLLAWSSQQLLPGYPFLEASLNATCSAYLPYLSGKDPQLNFSRALRAFEQAGIQQARVRSFVRDIQAPVAAAERAALASLFEMLWGQPQPEVAAEDWAAFQCLCRPASPHFLVDLPEYYGFFTYTLFQGLAPRR